MFKYRKILFGFLVLALILGAILLSLSTTKKSGSSSGLTEHSKIISLSPSATEDLFAMGAGDRVIAVDDLSNFPSNAPISKLSAFNPNVEALSAYQPDLVIINATATKAISVESQLKSLGIDVYLEKTPTTLSDAYSEISDLGSLSGKTPSAAQLIASMKSKIAAAIKNGKSDRHLAIYHELDNTLYSATSQTFIGRVYSSFHLTNIADAAAQADSGGYPQLQREYLIKANPDIIYLADAQYGESAATVAKRAGWSSISAVSNGGVVALPADIPSRWGPRLVDFYQLIATSLLSVK